MRGGAQVSSRGEGEADKGEESGDDMDDQESGQRLPRAGRKGEFSIVV